MENSPGQDWEQIRFLSSKSTNAQLHSYTANNPLKFVDKNGEFLQYVAALLLPNVAGAPDVGQESTIGNGVERAIFVAGFAAPAGKAQQVANQTTKAANAVKGKAYDSFGAFKRDVGPAGQGRDWHHLVEQNPTNKLQFGERALQNTDNLVNIPRNLHRKITGFYNSNIAGPGSQSVRSVVNQMSFKQQLDYAKATLNRIKKQLEKDKG